MIHAFTYIFFILPFTAWLGFELKRECSLRTHWMYLLGAFLLGIIGSIVSQIYPSNAGNFFLHASGGASATLLYIYFLKTLKLEFNWRLNLVILFAFVCMLGVLNELAEYLFELLGMGIFSLDTHDTWRDFVANTTGALLTWAICLPVLFKKQINANYYAPKYYLE